MEVVAYIVLVGMLATGVWSLVDPDAALRSAGFYRRPPFRREKWNRLYTRVVGSVMVVVATFCLALVVGLIGHR
jgi:hypothetical protein